MSLCHFCMLLCKTLNVPSSPSYCFIFEVVPVDDVEEDALDGRRLSADVGASFLASLPCDKRQQTSRIHNTSAHVPPLHRTSASLAVAATRADAVTCLPAAALSSLQLLSPLHSCLPLPQSVSLSLLLMTAVGERLHLLNLGQLSGGLCLQPNARIIQQVR